MSTILFLIAALCGMTSIFLMMGSSCLILCSADNQFRLFNFMMTWSLRTGIGACALMIASFFALALS